MTSSSSPAPKFAAFGLLALLALGAAQPSCAASARSEVAGSCLIQQERKVEHSAWHASEDGAGAASEAARLEHELRSVSLRAGAVAEEVSVKKCLAEFVAMALFVFFGCGSAMSVAKEPGWVLQVSLTFGLAITVLAYTVGHYSGGQINCAVTFGLMLAGKLSVAQGICNFLSQMLGAVLGAAVLKVAYPEEKDLTGGLGTNSVAEGWTKAGALIAEFVGTFLLMYVVFETAVNDASKANAALAPLAIGLAVFLAHSVLIPIDGCSINPTRSFGPALVQTMSGAGPGPFKDMWVFWVGPLAGAAGAAALYATMSA